VGTADEAAKGAAVEGAGMTVRSSARMKRRRRTCSRRALFTLLPVAFFSRSLAVSHHSNDCIHVAITSLFCSSVHMHSASKTHVASRERISVEAVLNKLGQDYVLLLANGRNVLTIWFVTQTPRCMRGFGCVEHRMPAYQRPPNL
jgi:hypothetical protein